MAATAKPGRKWRPVPQVMIELFDDLLATFPDAERRKMFGCPCAFVNGQMFAGLHQEDMILRLSEPDREAFLTIEGARQFEPSPGRAMKQYVVVPQEMLHAKADLRIWLTRAHDWTMALPPKAAKKRTPRTQGRGR